MISLQRFRDIQNEMRVIFYPLPPKENFDGFIAYYCDHLIEEAGEIKKEINWKTGRAAHFVDKEKLSKEVIDAFLMILNLMTVLDLSDEDVYDIMREKHVEGFYKIPDVDINDRCVIDNIYSACSNV